MAKKRGRKRSRSKKPKWGPTRTIDGKTFYRDYVYSRKSSAQARAKHLQKNGHNARVISKPGSYAVYMLPLEHRLTERQIDIAVEVSERRYGKAQSSDIKGSFVRDKPGESTSAISKDVKDLARKGILEKTEPKDDIEPTWKLTKKGREMTDYDPHAFD